MLFHYEPESPFSSGSEAGSLPGIRVGELQMHFHRGNVPQGTGTYGGARFSTCWRLNLVPGRRRERSLLGERYFLKVPVLMQRTEEEVDSFPRFIMLHLEHHCGSFILHGSNLHDLPSSGKNNRDFSFPCFQRTTHTSGHVLNPALSQMTE